MDTNRLFNSGHGNKVVLNINAIGRRNSGIPNDRAEPDFDDTYGGWTSLKYLVGWIFR